MLCNSRTLTLCYNMTLYNNTWHYIIQLDIAIIDVTIVAYTTIGGTTNNVKKNFFLYAAI